MGQFWQNLFGYGAVVAWVGGVVVFGMRANARWNAYLARHPLLDGVPFYLHQYADRLVLDGWGGPVWRVRRQPQADPELERLRQDGWRHNRYVTLWVLGFPFLFFGVLALLVATGIVR